MAVGLVALLLGPSTLGAAPNFLAPGGQVNYLADPAPAPPIVIEWPVPDWNRGGAHSTYAEWDTFGYTPNAMFPSPNIVPDVGFSGFAEPTQSVVNELTTYGFYTSTKNIYSFSVALEFTATLPAPVSAGSGSTYFVAQVGTTGTEVDMASMLLSFDGGGQKLAPSGMIETKRVGSTGEQALGGDEVSTLFWWDSFAGQPQLFELEFKAIEASMSLANLALDSFVLAAPSIAGDFDGNGYVDAADYALWKQHFGTSNSVADGNGDGVVNLADYSVWRDNLGAGTPPTLGGLTSTSVPEPSGTQVIMMVLLVAGFCGWANWLAGPTTVRRR